MTEPTARQIEIIALLARGRSRADVMAELHMADGTIKKHLREAYARLGARNIGHAVGICYERGLIKRDGS